MACPGLTAACGLPTAPARSCADRVKRIVSVVPGLMVLHTGLDLCTAPARSCTDSFLRRAGSAEGLIANSGMPRTYGRLWPAHRASAKLHRSCMRRIGSVVPGLMVLHISLDLHTAPAQSCNDSDKASRVDSRTHSRFFPAQRPIVACNLPYSHLHAYQLMISSCQT